MTYEYTHLLVGGQHHQRGARWPDDPTDRRSSDRQDQWPRLRPVGARPVSAAPLTTGWISPGGRLGAVSLTDKVHYVAFLKRAGAH
jgi:hypothetical protein